MMIRGVVLRYSPMVKRLAPSVPTASPIVMPVAVSNFPPAVGLSVDHRIEYISNVRVRLIRLGIDKPSMAPLPIIKAPRPRQRSKISRVSDPLLYPVRELGYCYTIVGVASPVLTEPPNEPLGKLNHQCSGSRPRLHIAL